jgi:signal transduction histidine kinase
MSIKDKIVISLSLLAFFAVIPAFAEVNAKDTAKRQAELSVQLGNASGSKKLEIIADLAELYWDVPEEEHWLEELFNEAEKQNNEEYEMKALLGLCRYCHNLEKEKELVAWGIKADSVAAANDYFTNDYFDAKAFVSKHFIWADNYEVAAEYAKDLYNKASEVKNEYGLIVSGEVLGLSYESIEKDSTAAVYLMEAKERLEKLGTTQPNYYAQLLSELAEATLDAGMLKEGKDATDQFLDMIHEIEKGNVKIENPESFPYERCHKMADVFYARYYLQKGKYETADSLLKKARSISQSDVYVDYLQVLTLAKYYLAIKNYAKAIAYADTALIIDNEMPSSLKLRAGIRQEAEDYAGAAEDYRLALQRTEGMNTASLNYLLAQQQRQHDISNLQIQLKDAKLKSDRTKLLFLLILLLVIVVVLALVSYYLIKTRKLKKLVEQDNEKLVKADRDIRKAVERAEQSDNLKKAFIENVNHEIRTPLNSIVGFSDVIADKAAETGNDEMKGMAAIVRSNSDTLLNLINGMLELSSLQAGTYQITVSTCFIRKCCAEQMKAAEGKIAEGVSLKLEPESQDFSLETDSSLLKRAIGKLVDNAVKYTQKGEIGISYRADAAKGKAFISVRDTGPGITPEKEEMLFHPFYKNDTFTQGLGIGLSECQIIAHRLGGSVWLDHSYTTGAKFVIELPLEPLEEVKE